MYSDVTIVGATLAPGNRIIKVISCGFGARAAWCRLIDAFHRILVDFGTRQAQEVSIEPAAAFGINHQHTDHIMDHYIGSQWITVSLIRLHDSIHCVDSLLQFMDRFGSCLSSLIPSYRYRILTTSLCT